MNCDTKFVIMAEPLGVWLSASAKCKYMIIVVIVTHLQGSLSEMLIFLMFLSHPQCSLH